MSAGDLFTAQMWESVLDELYKQGQKVPVAWWEDHGGTLQGIALDEVKAVAKAFRKGDTTEAKLVIAGNMDPADFAFYVMGTTKELQDMARRRAELMDALEDLGWRTAKAIGAALLAAVAL